MVLGLCERFHCLPSALDEESAEVIRLVTIHALGTKREEPGEVPGYEEGE
ncbi:MAG TPA: hypothetical protein VLA89_05480 [Gemmatimonadales bacterium]|nr:hypothetical protein [Gemmatimonadales bacterium]